jgi:2-polyprenyl-3-methyl-5-hydroxy-6-metoxy-1,4-benzoquinol methylase
MTIKTFYDYKDPLEAAKAFLQAHNTLDDKMREKSIKRFLTKHLSSVSSKSVLDVGAGPGIWTKFWIDEGAKVTALDVHRPILLANQMRNPEAEFVEADATTFILPKKYDLIFAKDLIEHLTDDEHFLRNAANHLKKNGYLVLTTQNWFSLNYFIEGGFKFLTGKMGWCGSDPTHVRFYNYRQLNKKLKNAGLTPVKYWSMYHFPYRFLSALFFKRVIEWKWFHLVECFNLYGYFPFNLTGWNIGVVAKKEKE